MKKFYFLGCVSLMLFFSAQQVKAQFDIGNILESGVSDASTYLQSYVEPAFRGFGSGLNSGWYNTAQPHQFLGFDITVNISAAMVPTALETFTFRNSDYSNVFYRDGSQVNVPTLMGQNLGADDLPELSFRDFNDLDNDGDTNDELLRISALTGLGLEEQLPVNAVPVPMAQIGIGLPKGTELKVRFLPEIDLDGEGSVQLFGLGVVHDIKQWLPGGDMLPLDLSAFVGFTNMKSSIVIDSDAGQTANFNASAWTAQVIASKQLLFFTFFGGVGYSNSNVDFSMLGTYETETETLVDPIDFSFSDSGLRANAGLRIKLLFLTLTGEYTIQEFNTITAGVGISIR